ncbi:hypothetical protein BU26DRAFT_506405 [Trematosphaeria pertusa]|uniref:Uncharacterized protein n=1 Tax=Trematosphaeria pertusa TaxID=390896 RepID=A0A6A6IC33_9PLEO|nr:uncharacterized protein BU26DRAFT_506405 [Trematosphaeria pertusa]KAF2247110.1 hypothetical protein BU26DRAFT_506405 [Trematosphaeria pertusa]
MIKIKGSKEYRRTVSEALHDTLYKTSANQLPRPHRRLLHSTRTPDRVRHRDRSCSRGDGIHLHCLNPSTLSQAFHSRPSFPVLLFKTALLTTVSVCWYRNSYAPGNGNSVSSVWRQKEN